MVLRFFLLVQENLWKNRSNLYQIMEIHESRWNLLYSFQKHLRKKVPEGKLDSMKGSNFNPIFSPHLPHKYNIIWEMFFFAIWRGAYRFFVSENSKTRSELLLNAFLGVNSPFHEIAVNLFSILKNNSREKI